MRTSVCAVLVVFIATWSATAWAWQGTQTCYPSGTYLCDPGEQPIQVRWKFRCVGYEINELGSVQLPRTADGLIAPEVIDTINTSFDTWNAVECSDLTFVYIGTTEDSSTEYVNSRGCEGNRNVIAFRDEEWPYAATSAFALTSVTFDPNSGLITDSDVELNTASHDFTITEDDVVIDLENTMTHEAGHFLGLDHSQVRVSTMFFSAAEGETRKRDLDDDDIEAICSIYPTIEEDRVCPNPPACNAPSDEDRGIDNGCCAVVESPDDRHLPLLFGLLFALGYVVRRRASSQN